MKLEEKYTSKTDNEKNKKVISDDIYAICEILQKIADKLDVANRKR